MHFRFSFLVAASVASGAVLRRDQPVGQDIPTTARSDNTFSNGKPQLTSEPPNTPDIPSETYGARDIDLPFGRLYHGDMKFFSAGQLNSPDGITDQWMGQPGVVDSAKQSACGIPDNAFSISKVAIHPYFLKYAQLDRYCMQDVCISFWNGKLAGQGQSDMILKVTDICSTDPNDPTHCAKPGDIKIDRTKAKIMEQIPGNAPVDEVPQVNGSQFDDGVSRASSETWWFFTKCWADALVQPAYADNWFAKPPIPNNLDWSQQTEWQQYQNNQKSYPLAKPPHPVYPNGAYNQTYVDIPITDWSPTEKDPPWCPVAGGKGWGVPTGACAGGSNQGSSSITTSGSDSTKTTKIPPSVAAAANGASSAPDAALQSTPSSSTSAPAAASSSPSSVDAGGSVQSTSSNGASGMGSTGSQGAATSKSAEESNNGDDEDDDVCER